MKYQHLIAISIIQLSYIVSTKDTEVRNEQDDAQLYKTRRRKNSSHCCISMMQCVPNKQVARVNIHISLSGSRLFLQVGAARVIQQRSIDPRYPGFYPAGCGCVATTKLGMLLTLAISRHEICRFHRMFRLV